MSVAVLRLLKLHGVHRVRFSFFLDHILQAIQIAHVWVYNGATVKLFCAATLNITRIIFIKQYRKIILSVETLSIIIYYIILLGEPC